MLQVLREARFLVAPVCNPCSFLRVLLILEEVHFQAVLVWSQSLLTVIINVMIHEEDVMQ